MSHAMNATINGRPVVMDRPSFSFQEEELPGGLSRPIHGTEKWAPISCDPHVDITPDFVAEAGPEQWAFHGARWENGKIRFESAIRTSVQTVRQNVVHTVCLTHKLDDGVESGGLGPGDERRVRASLLRRMANELEQLIGYLPAGKLRFHESDIDPAIHLVAEVRPTEGDR